MLRQSEANEIQEELDEQISIIEREKAAYDKGYIDATAGFDDSSID